MSLANPASDRSLTLAPADGILHVPLRTLDRSSAVLLPLDQIPCFLKEIP
jgi:hypothetical protein